MALHRQATALQWNSAFDRAYTAAQEGYRLALEVGYGAGVHLATMAFVEAVRGRTEEAWTHAHEALAIGRRSGSNLLSDTAELTIAFVDLAAGKPEAAADRLFALTAADRPRGHRLFALAAVPDLVEVAARIGRQSEVREPLARYASWVAASGGETGLALLARCQALTGQRDPAEGFSEALDRAAALAPFERARTELLYGEWLPRQALETAFVHCRPGGVAVFVPDETRETFEESSDQGGSDGACGRAVRYMEWSWDPDPADTWTLTEFVFLHVESSSTS